MKHIMKLNPAAFEMIKSGTKTIEFRLYDEKRKLIEIGDDIEFSKLPNLKETISTKVIGLTKAPNFETLFTIINPVTGGWEKTDSIIKAVQDMNKFYSTEEENKYGVLAIHLERLN